MISLGQVGGRLSLLGVAFLAVSIVFGPSARADDCACTNANQGPNGGTVCPIHGQGQAVQGGGTLGYGPPGVYPGFQGFGIGYHLGYGYGGAGLGVGADGGYPFYGGPGYPHCPPPLRRLGRIQPFAYYGGPGHSTPEQPNYFGGVGPLVPDQPVITIASETGNLDYATGYGAFTGVVPYPESYFAPFTAAAAAEGSSSGASTPGGSAPPTGAAPNAAPPPPPPTAPPASGPGPGLPAQGSRLGIEQEPVVEAGGLRALKVSKVYPRTAAETAGLHAGDVIRSINGYRTKERSDLAWIIANAAPNRVLSMSVRRANDGEVRKVALRLP
jgi:hypothetical protein